MLRFSERYNSPPAVSASHSTDRDDLVHPRVCRQKELISLRIVQ